MDMNNYLNSLKNKIENLPEDYKNEILNDYKNHFEEGILIGKTENDIACGLGDVDFIAKNIIAEYYIENSDNIDSARNILKALLAIANVGIGTLNLLIVTPFILSVTAFVICLYIFDFCFIITPILLLANLIIPTLPISFGTEILWLKILYVLVFVVAGFFLYKVLKKISRKFFSWIFVYIIKSIKFQAFNINRKS